MRSLILNVDVQEWEEGQREEIHNISEAKKIFKEIPHLCLP
jgi:hypothetical protein